MPRGRPKRDKINTTQYVDNEGIARKADFHNSMRSNVVQIPWTEIIKDLDLGGRRGNFKQYVGYMYKKHKDGIDITPELEFLERSLNES